jgi:hypothetical protein
MKADGTMLKVVDIINKQLLANMKKSDHWNLMALSMFPVTFYWFNLKSMLF